MRNWPVVVSKRAAQACAEEFGLPHPDPARRWLYTVIDQRGRVTDELPPAARTMRSKSGYFMVANDVVVLPLMASSDGTARWIATDCKVLPAYRTRYPGAERHDPFRLSEAELLSRVSFSRQALTEFQRFCGGDSNPEIARDEMHQILDRGFEVSAEPPGWCKAPRADFYLVSFDEYVMPMAPDGSGGFSARGCLHRASGLFGLRGAELATRCRYDADALDTDPERWDAFVAAAARTGQLSWHRPEWARPDAEARFWLVVSPRLAAPVAWQPYDASRPLLILDIQERLPLWDRIRRYATRALERLR